MVKRTPPLVPSAPDAPVPVAQYVRMSTDHQRYSTQNQRDVLERYAASHGMHIVQTYADEGKSGLSLEGRDALKRLIADVQRPPVSFHAILVYDISRWGRFQDADESAYYEHLCRRAGLQVVYCAEPFANDGSPMSVIMKSVKRAMAGEYSRELSHKVFLGQCRLIELGFRQGGAPGFGLRRLLLDEKREPKGMLQPGERKSLQTDRVVLVLGPDAEVATVQRIYALFVKENQGEAEIAERLNAESITTDRDRRWTRGTVHQVLTNEKYIGHNVYNQTSFKLKKKRIRNAPEMWVRADGVFPAVVDPEVFEQARVRIAARSQPVDDETMLSQLRRLHEHSGVLSGLLIDEQEGMPSSSAYRQRFGGLLRAYALIGYRPDHDFRYVSINQQLRARLPGVVAEVVDRLTHAGNSVRQDAGTGLLHLNDECTISVVIARCLQRPSGSYRWCFRFDAGLSPDITIAIRMASDQKSVLDYYLFPKLDRPLRVCRLAEHNDVAMDAYRFDKLDAFYVLMTRVPLRACA